MKRRYRTLIFLIVAVFIVFSTCLGDKLEASPPIVQGLAMSAFLIPACLLLYFISKDNNINQIIRNIAKFGIIFMIVCFAGGLMVEI